MRWQKCYQYTIGQVCVTTSVGHTAHEHGRGMTLQIENVE